ncbi:MAG: hypothetical protein HYU34_00880 [Candidatus Omnitrophica bacterium]|nr:hypothetical protein [Candidatus Omnitrophota bacterium]
MNRRKRKSVGLIVTQEAIQEFSRLSTRRRLQWLDEMRSFLSRALPPRTKQIYESFRREGISQTRSSHE